MRVGNKNLDRVSHKCRLPAQRRLREGARCMRLPTKKFIYLEDVETLVLNHLSVILQQVHAQLQMLAAVDILRHYAIVGSVEEDLSEKLNRLSFCYVRVGLD